MQQSPSPQELRHRFETHDVNAEQSKTITVLRHQFLELAEQIAALVPHGRDQALALTKLEEAAFHAVAGVARGV